MPTIDLYGRDGQCQMMDSDRPFLGILCMLAFCILAPLGDVIAKLIGDSVPLMLVLIARFGLQFCLLIPVMLVVGIAFTLPRQIAWWMVLRSLLHIIGVGTMYLALRYLPIADALAIAFVMPFIMLILGKYVLDEAVGPRRLTACIIGFGGTLLVIQPSFVAVGAAAFLPLIVAVVFSIFMLITRIIAKSVDPIALQTHSGAIGTLTLIAIYALVPAGLHPDFGMVMPNLTLGLMLVAVGVLGTLAHLMMTISLRYAPSATVAPMQYLEIPIATILGWFVFHQLPNGLAQLGIIITIGAGLFIILMEHRLARSVDPAGTATKPDGN